MSTIGRAYNPYEVQPRAKKPQQQPPQYNSGVKPRPKKQNQNDNQNVIVKKETIQEPINDQMSMTPKLLNSQWNVFYHRDDNPDWSESSYSKFYKIDTLSSFWKFFSNFSRLDKNRIQYFIMRNGINPTWEDVNNRTGGVLSIKIDVYQTEKRSNDRNSQYERRNDLAIEIMTCICMLIMNECFIKTPMDINGITFNCKSKITFIKIWIRDFKKYEKKINDCIPSGFMEKIFDVITSYNYGVDTRMKNDVSIKFMPIIPQK